MEREMEMTMCRYCGKYVEVEAYEMCAMCNAVEEADAANWDGETGQGDGEEVTDGGTGTMEY